MLNENARNWLADLRSGEFAQATGALYRDDNKKGYCCLGVACVRYQKDVKPDLRFNNSGTWVVDLESDTSAEGLLPPTIAEYFGGLTIDAQNTLANLNDDEHYSFPEIANYIEEHADELFRDDAE